MSWMGETLSRQEFEGLVARVENRRERHLELDIPEFDRRYNQIAFTFAHHLTSHPLLDVQALFELCRRLPRRNIRCRAEHVPPDADFDDSLERYKHHLTLDEVVERFDEQPAYIAIYNPELDGAYRPLIEDTLGEIGARIRPIDSPINWYSSYIFISTSGSLTPYHMDREMNFLLQVRGTKTAKLWDRFDFEVMSESDQDTLLADRTAARPGYRPSLEDHARVFELSPARGLHHPFIAPHLITTNTDISVSLAITYRTELSDVWTDAHHFNYLARRLGLSPRYVGRDRYRDRLKAAAVRTLRQAKRPIERVRRGLSPRVG